MPPSWDWDLIELTRLQTMASSHFSFYRSFLFYDPAFCWRCEYQASQLHCSLMSFSKDQGIESSSHFPFAKNCLYSIMTKVLRFIFLSGLYCAEYLNKKLLYIPVNNSRQCRLCYYEYICSAEKMLWMCMWHILITSFKSEWFFYLLGCPSRNFTLYVSYIPNGPCFHFLFLLRQLFQYCLFPI